jgi:hypothetical protein
MSKTDLNVPKKFENILFFLDGIQVTPDYFTVTGFKEHSKNDLNFTLGYGPYDNRSYKYGNLISTEMFGEDIIFNLKTEKF